MCFLFPGPSGLFFNHSLRAVTARSAFFDKSNALFSTKNPKITYRLKGCSVLNVLNSGKWGVKSHNYALLLDFPAHFFYHTARMPLFSTIIFIIFWDFLMVYQIFLSPQVKPCEIITYTHGIYELPHELPNDLKW